MSDKQYGYVAISRKAYKTDPFWNEARVRSRWEAWEDLIQLAAFAPHRVQTTGGMVELARGEVLASLSYLAARWQWGTKRVRLFLACLQNMERIQAQRKTQAGSVYLLVNYQFYQSRGTVADRAADIEEGTPVARRGHTEDTNIRREERETASSTARARRQLSPEARHAFDCLVRACQSADAFVAELNALVSGTRNIRPAPTWDAISLAIQDLHLNGEPPTARALRTYTAHALRQLTTGYDAGTGNGDHGNEFERALGRRRAKQEERA